MSTSLPRPGANRQRKSVTLGDQSKRAPALQVRKLNSTPSLSPKTSTRAPRSSASSALHLGKAACNVPEHDAMAKRNERMKELLKKEKESVQVIREEFDEKESLLLREKAQLQHRLDQLLAEKTQQAQRHATEVDMMSQKQREMMAQVEKTHQREMAEQLRRHDTSVSEKQKVIETLKAQIAELMTGQSSTRHAQIDELRKKLIDAAKEANELKTEIMRFRGTKDENHRLNRPQEGMQLGVQIGVCMNCIVMQQALTMANAALKSKMRELERIEQVGKNIRLGLELNDLALDAIDPSKTDKK